MKRLVSLSGVLCATVSFLVPSLFAAGSGGWQSQTLFDPIMRMNAYTITYPDGWKMERCLVTGVNSNRGSLALAWDDNSLGEGVEGAFRRGGGCSGGPRWRSRHW